MRTTSTEKIEISKQLSEILQAVISIYEHEAINFYKVEVERYNANFNSKKEKYVKIRHMIIYLSAKFVDSVINNENIKMQGFNNNIIADCFKIERSNVHYIKKRLSKKEKYNLLFSDEVKILEYRAEGHILTLRKKAFDLIKKYYL